MILTNYELIGVIGLSSMVGQLIGYAVVIYLKKKWNAKINE